MQPRTDHPTSRQVRGGRGVERWNPSCVPIQVAPATATRSHRWSTRVAEADRRAYVGTALRRVGDRRRRTAVAPPDRQQLERRWARRGASGLAGGHETAAEDDGGLGSSLLVAVVSWLLAHVASLAVVLGQSRPP